MIGSRRRGDLRLFVGSDRGEDLGSDHLGDLDEEPADTAGGGVDETPVTGGERIRVPGEIMRRHPLEHDGGGDVVPDAVGHGDGLICRDRDELGVGADGERPRHSIPDVMPIDTVAEGNDLPGPFETRHEGQLHGIEPAAVVRVDVVEAGPCDPDQDLAGSWCRIGELAELQDIGPAGRGDDDRFHARRLSHGAGIGPTGLVTTRSAFIADRSARSHRATRRRAPYSGSAANDDRVEQTISVDVDAPGDAGPADHLSASRPPPWGNRGNRPGGDPQASCSRSISRAMMSCWICEVPS